MKTNTRFPSRTKQFLAGLLIFSSLNYVAQSGITNFSFESWTTNMMGPAPTGWFGINLNQQTSGAQQGGKYARITNTNLNQGMLMLGTLTTFTGSGTFNGGAPYTQNPAALNGFYKTSGVVFGDTLGITAFTSKSGTLNAYATKSFTANVATWTSFSIPFMTLGGGPVDSLFIMVSSGNISGGNDNSLTATLDVDNFSVATLTGIDKRSLGTAFMVYPNPASNELNIISKEEKAVMILITDLNGRVIEERAMESEKTKLDLQAYQAGIYFYSILDQDKAILFTNKFVVAK